MKNVITRYKDIFIQVEKFAKKGKIQNVHQQRSCDMWKERLQNQDEVE
jgi:hypothetical protein